MFHFCLMKKNIYFLVCYLKIEEVIKYKTQNQPIIKWVWRLFWKWCILSFSIFSCCGWGPHGPGNLSHPYRPLCISSPNDALHLATLAAISLPPVFRFCRCHTWKKWHQLRSWSVTLISETFKLYDVLTLLIYFIMSAARLCEKK